MPRHSSSSTSPARWARVQQTRRRGSTRLAETRLSFDTVFLINRFLEAASQAVVDSGGQPNQFVGDGIMALFGVESGAAQGCRDATCRSRRDRTRADGVVRLDDVARGGALYAHSEPQGAGAGGRD